MDWSTLIPKSKKTLENAAFCKISHSGRYYVNSLIFEIVYLNNVLIDTPITDRELVYSLRSSINNTGFYEICKRVKEFKDFLVKEAIKEKKQFPEFCDNDLGKYSIIPKLEETVTKKLNDQNQRLYAKKKYINFTSKILITSNIDV